MKKLQRVGPFQKPAGTQVGTRGGHVGVGIAGLGSVPMCAKNIQSRRYRNVFPL